MATRRDGDELRPYSHVAIINGAPTVFANVEYPEDEPPRVIEIRGQRWVREEDGQ